MKLEEMVRLTQPELFNAILHECRQSEITSSADKYILVHGDVPILLVAHLDTVHKEIVQTICTDEEHNILMSPEGIGGDDRCGVYALLQIYHTEKREPWLLFTCDEESGGIGASAFCSDYSVQKISSDFYDADIKCIIEVDRRGKEDAVYYDCDNIEFEEYISSKGFITAYGSYSDICEIAPEMDVAAVNLSSGYYNAHTQYEYINQRELNVVIDKIREIIHDADSDEFPVYEYVRRAREINSTWRSWYYGWDMPSVPSNVPKEIRTEYQELLEYGYTVDELEDYRDQMGDYAIMLLYEETTSYYEYQKEEESET